MLGRISHATSVQTRKGRWLILALPVQEECSMLTIATPRDDGLRRGHLVHSLIRWLGNARDDDGSSSSSSSSSHSTRSPPLFDFLLKTELSTRGLDVTGLKAELVTRLTEAVGKNMMDSFASRISFLSLHRK